LALEYVMRLCDVEAALREVVAGLEPGTLPAEAAAGLVDTLPPSRGWPMRAGRWPPGG